jgi:ABC-2 type transport system permease protein
MRLWAEERRSGTIEILFTLPFTMFEAVLAKFLAGWSFLAVSLLPTIPLWVSVNYLGHPDNGVIFAGYLGALLMAGAYLAVCCFTSALSKNQVIGFVLGVVICFLLVLAGWGVFTDLLGSFLPSWCVDLFEAAGFITHFQSITRGLLDSRDVIYFLSAITVGLALNVITLNLRKAR